MNKMKKLGLIVLFAAVFAVVPVNKTYATKNGLYKKAILNSAYDCYNSSNLVSSVNVDDYDTFAKSILKAKKKSSTNIFLPSKVGNTIDDTSGGVPKVGCYEIFLGDKTGVGTYGGSMKGVFEAYGKTAVVNGSTSKTEIVNFVKNIGYTEASGTSTTNNKKYCVDITTGTGREGDSWSKVGNICWNEVDLKNGFDSPIELAYAAKSSDSKKIWMGGLGQLVAHDDKYGDCSFAQTAVPNKNGKYDVSSVEAFKNYDAIQCVISNVRDGGDVVFKGSYNEKSDSTQLSNEYSVKETEKRRGTFSSAYKVFAKYLSGAERSKFSDNEKYELYGYYLADVYKTTQSDRAEQCQKNKPSSAVETSGGSTKYWIKTTDGWCTVSVDSNYANLKVSGFSEGGSGYVLDKAMTFKDVIEAMFKLSPDDDVLMGPDGTTSSKSDEEGEKAESDPCYTASGALGWFVCPVIKAASDALSSIYGKYIEPLLQTNSGILSSLAVDGNNGVYGAWSLFRNIANIVFIIMFLVVIFSQLTGVGIDNYGIKRALPRLIVTAVLVNFSFLICQLAVDLSNIFGAGLKDLLIGLANDQVKNVVVSGGVKGGSAGGTFTTVGGAIEVIILAITSGAVATVLTGMLWVLPLLLTILSGLVAVFFGFVILGVRQAAILLLVVTSPIAFVLYILPNTNKLFQKWSKLFINLLLVYPAVGLLIGGFYFAARIILLVDSGSFIFQLVGLLLLCAPYFFIIPLVSGSLKAINGIGDKIRGFGQKATDKGIKAVKGSDAYKTHQQLQATKGTSWRNKIANTKFGKRTGFRRQLARQNQAWEETQQKDRVAGAYLDRIADEWQPNSVLNGRVSEALDGKGDFDIAMERAASQDMKGTADYISSMLSDASFNIEEKDADGKYTANALSNQAKLAKIQSYMSNNDKFAQQLKRRDKTAFEFANSRGMNKAGEYKNINDAAFGSDQTMDDRMTQNTTALKRDTVDGKFTSQMANAMVSENAPPAVKTGIASDAGKRPVLEQVAAMNPSNDVRDMEGNKVEHKDAKTTKAEFSSQMAGKKALKFANGGNIAGQSGVLNGYEKSGFNATEAYTNNKGEIYLKNANGEYWDAKNGKVLGNMDATVGNAGWTKINM